MYKKFHLITGLCIIFNSFQVQPSSENTNAAIGIGLFTSSIICMKIAQHWNRPQTLDRALPIPLIPSTTQTGPALSRVDNSNVQPAQQIHSDAIPANHINQHDRRRNQNQYVSNSSNNSYRIATQNNNAKTPSLIYNSLENIQNKNNESVEIEVLSKDSKNQLLARRAIMTSLSSRYQTEEQQWFHTIFNKEQQRQTKDQIHPQLDHLYNQKHEAYKQNNPSVAPKLLTFTKEWHQTENEAQHRLLILEELKPIARLDDSTKLQKFLRKNVSNIETTQAERAIFFGEKENESHAHAITISTERTFTPKNSSTNEIIYLPVIHGTFAKKGKSFGDDETHPITESMILYAQRMALEKNAVVKLLVIKWSGEWDEKARVESGQNLANQLNARIAKEKSNPNINISVQVIAHSYGCDVARIMIQKSSQDIQFGHAFFLASPPTHIDVSDRVQDFHIYGDLDGVATAEAWRLSNCTTTSIHNSLAHANIRAKIEGEDLNHKSIKSIIRYLHEIPTITENYPKENAFIVHIDNEKRVTTFDKNENQDEDESDLQDIPHDMQYNLITLIDTSNRNPAIPLTEDIEIKDIIAQDQLKQIRTLANLYEKRSYQDAFNSEVASGEGQASWIKTILINCVGFFENIFGGSPSSPTSSKSTTPPLSPNESETTSESRTPSRSPMNQSRHTTPPLKNDDLL